MHTQFASGFLKEKFEEPRARHARLWKDECKVETEVQTHDPKEVCCQLTQAWC